MGRVRRRGLLAGPAAAAGAEHEAQQRSHHTRPHTATNCLQAPLAPTRELQRDAAALQPLVQLARLQARHLAQLRRRQRVKLQRVEGRAREEGRERSQGGRPGLRRTECSTAAQAQQAQHACTISSMRLRNSGLKWCRTTSITAARASAPLPRSSRMLAPWGGGVEGWHGVPMIKSGWVRRRGDEEERRREQRGRRSSDDRQ